MNAQATRRRRLASLSQRAAVAICPRGEREWIHAMFAELGAIDGAQRRLDWCLGAGSVVLTAIQLRARAAISQRLRIGIALALGAALACGLLSYADANALRIDDDLLAAVSCAWLAVLAALAAVAARDVFVGQREIRDQG